jgi:hypothetical protein
MPGDCLRWLAVSACLWEALCGSVPAEQPRAFKAGWATEAPVIDGRLDDTCWKKAPVVTRFLLIHTDLVAPFQSLGYFAHDAENLYVGMKCLKIHDARPRGKIRDRGEYFFADDIVEILIDPGQIGDRYYQFVVNAYGSQWETARSARGTKHDPRWRADWQSAAHIAPDYWSMEVAIPYYNFGALSNLKQDWSVNLCRQSHTPYAYSSAAPLGAFHDPGVFCKLTGLRGPFDRYHIAVESDFLRPEPTDFAPGATLCVPVVNVGDRPRTVDIDQFVAGEQRATQSQTVTLRPGATFELKTDSLDLEPILAGRNDVYLVGSKPKTDRVVVRDSADRTILSQHFVREPHYLEVMDLEVTDPWQKTLVAGHTGQVSLVVTTGFDADVLGESSLHVALLDRGSLPGVPKTALPLVERTIEAPDRVVTINLPVDAVRWGSYVVQARLVDRSNRELTSAVAPVNILPGPPHQVVVLNNLVSELANTRKRGLSGERHIEMMNPRDGWVWFQLAGSGTARVDGQDITLTAGEAMHRLPAGRHALLLEGPVEQLIARAVPELLYTQFPSGPGAMGYDVTLYKNRQDPRSSWTGGVALGPYEWDFLQQHVLKNCNVIAGDTDQQGPMAGWTGLGRRWISTTGAPGYHMFGPAPGKFATAAESVRYWTGDEGYTDPLASGGIADDCSNATEQQFIEWARAMRLLSEDPRWARHTFYPWVSWAFGSDGSRAFLRTVVELDWKYAFYQYLPEQSSEADAWKLIQQSLVGPVEVFNQRSWQSVRNMIASPGIMSHPPLSQNVNPGVNFKTHMDLQMQTFANHAAYFGLYGMQWYYSAYADEENTRWAGHLYRHYCIEGRTEPASNDPYELAHIHNPDFEQGMRGWTIDAASPGSVRESQLAGYGESLQGRYLGGSRGDKFLVIKRSGEQPNQISQSMRNFEPGRLYSVKIMTANWDDVRGGRSAHKPSQVRIELEGARMEPRHRTNYWFTYPQNWGNSLGKFDYENRAYTTYHWYVFRAQGSEARLVISDWLSEKDPGGPVGQEVLVNFVEVQPYFE